MEVEVFNLCGSDCFEEPHSKRVDDGNALEHLTVLRWSNVKTCNTSRRISDTQGHINLLIVWASLVQPTEFGKRGAWERHFASLIDCDVLLVRQQVKYRENAHSSKVYGKDYDRFNQACFIYHWRFQIAYFCLCCTPSRVFRWGHLCWYWAFLQWDHFVIHRRRTPLPDGGALFEEDSLQLSLIRCGILYKMSERNWPHSDQRLKTQPGIGLFDSRTHVPQSFHPEQQSLWIKDKVKDHRIEQSNKLEIKHKKSGLWKNWYQETRQLHGEKKIWITYVEAEPLSPSLQPHLD